MCKLDAWENIYERDVLYQQVWSMPVLQLAKGYGISNSGLKKICLQLDIPIPPAGYWAKIRVGRAVGPPPLLPSGVSNSSGRRTVPRTEEFSVYGVASEQYLKNRIADSQAQIDNFQLPLLPADTKLTFDGESLAFLGNKMAARIHEIVAKLRVRESRSLNDRKNAIIENLSKAAEQIGGNICEMPPVMYMDAYYKQYNRLSAGLLHSYFVYMGSYVRLQFLEDSKSTFAIILCCYYDGSALSLRESPKKLPLEKELQWTDSYEFPLKKQIGEVFLGMVTLAGFMMQARQRNEALDSFGRALRHLELMQCQLEQEKATLQQLQNKQG